MHHMDMHPNRTAPHISLPNPDSEFVAFSALIPFVVLTLVGCATALVLYVKRRIRLEELRHRLIPVYSYDPAEEDRDSDHRALDSEEELAELLCKDGRAS